MISFISRLFKSAPSEDHSTTPASQQANKPTTAPIQTVQDYGPALVKSAIGGATTKEKNASRQRIGELLDAGTVTLEQITSDSENTEQVLILCSYSQATAEKVLAGITEQTALAKLANEAPTAPIRKIAAEKVTERAALESMLKGAKGGDKNVYKIARTGLAAFKAEDEALAKKHAQLESLCVDAERHAKKPFDHLYTHKFMSLEKDWQAGEANSTEALQTRFDEAIARCQAVIDEQVAQSRAKALAEQQASAAVTNLIAKTEGLNPIAAALYTAETINDEVVEQSQKQLSSIGDEVRDLVAEQDGNEKDFQQAHRRYVQAAETVNGLLVKLQESGSLSTALSNLKEADKSAGESLRRTISTLLSFGKKLNGFESEITTQAQAAISEWEQEQNKKAAERKAMLDAIGDLSRRANGAARNGQVRRARGIYKELNEKRAQAEDLPMGMVNKLEQLDETIAKLGDWHEFAVTPKKQELVEKMTKLQESTLAPDDLADKIHELQDEWKVLCKGGENQDEDLWKAFQEAADKAFEPCKKYFAAQAEMREKNATERRSLIEQLAQYHEAYDWEKAVWKDVEQTLRVAKDTWKALWPVPRQQQKDIQQAFDAVLDKIYAHMNTAYDLGKQKKEQLIALAEKAGENSDVKAAAEEIKKLQASWKDAGRTYRKADQELWKKFRAISDTIFEKRQALYDEVNAERDALVNSANEIIDKVKELVKEGGEKLQSQGAAIDELKQTFEGLGDLPKAQFQKFQEAVKSIDDAISHHRSSAERQAWSTLFELNTQLSAYEAAPSEEGKTTISEAVTTQKLPSGCADIFKKRIESTEPLDSENATKALRLLCIRAEITNGKESPEADRNIRMTYQVEALQHGLGTASADTNESLTKEWIALAGCPVTELEGLQKRFLDTAF